jgi:hypothetical protein
MDGFENLSLEEKAKIACDEGIYMESITYYNATVNLYSWNKVFIEVYYHPATNEIERISIATDQDMNKYISRIDIKDF